MNKESIAIAVFLMMHYGILSSHLIDVHLPTAEEDAMMDGYDRDKENEAAKETLNDPDASYDDKIDAIETLIENGALA